MEHRFRRKWFENTTFCIAVVKLACTGKVSKVKVEISEHASLIKLSAL